MKELLFYSSILNSAFQRLGGPWPIAHLDDNGLSHRPSRERPQEMKSQRRAPVPLKDSLGV